LRASTQASGVADKICRKIKAAWGPAASSAAAVAGRFRISSPPAVPLPANRLTNPGPEARYAAERAAKMGSETVGNGGR